MRVIKMSFFVVACTVLAALVGSATHSDAQTPKAQTATLTWNANTETDLAGYKVFRGTGAACSGTAALPALTVASTPVTLDKALITYVDPTIPQTDGLSICYELSAYDTSGNESARSNRAVASVNSNPPLAPQNLGVVIK